jgi:hypothetical protein
MPTRSYGVPGSGGPGTDEESNERDQKNQGDEGLGENTVEAPDLEDVGLDVTEVKGESESGDREEEGEPTVAEKGGEGDGGVSEDAGECDGEAVSGSCAIVDVGMARFAEVEEDPVEGGVGTSVHAATVPMGIDVTGLDAGGVVDVQGEGGNEDTG